MTDHNKRIFLNLQNDIKSKEDIPEQKIIESIRMTCYEKVLKILDTIRSSLIGFKASDSIVLDLDWVIARIQTNTLYTYSLNIDGNEEFKSLSKNSKDVQHFLDMLADFSEVKQNAKRNVDTINYNQSVMSRTIGNLSAIGDNKKASSFFKKFKDGNSVISEKRKSDPKLEYSSEKGAISLIDSPSRGNIDNFVSPVKNIIKEEEEENKDNISFDLDENSYKINRGDGNNTQRSLSPRTEKNSNLFIVAKTMSDDDSIYKINQQIIGTIEEKDFNIFSYLELVERELVLKSIYKYIIGFSDLDDLIEQKNLESFLEKIYNGYSRSVQYHNDLHGIDVCHTLFTWVEYGSMESTLSLNNLDLLSLYTAATVHDFKHFGFNNTFLINQLSDLSLTYNDKSVLENFHTYEAFKVILTPDSNIFLNLEPENFKLIRKRMIECILATDMVTHAKVVSVIKAKITNFQISNGNNSEKLVQADSKTFFDDQQEVLSYLIHTADLSHNSKEFAISKKWTELLFEEYYHQGDVEKSKNMPVSFLCDRTTTQVERSQIGFIKAIISPTFEIMLDIFPGLLYLRDNIKRNIEEWDKLATIKEKEIQEKSKNI